MTRAYAAFSPGTLLMIEVTEQHLDDPNIMATDSCAVPDHPVMSRLWSERKPIGTIVVGLTPRPTGWRGRPPSSCSSTARRATWRAHQQPGSGCSSAEPRLRQAEAGLG